jgi:hypothetical protein
MPSVLALSWSITVFFTLQLKDSDKHYHILFVGDP